MFRSHNKTENSVPYTSNTFEKPYSMNQEAKTNKQTKQEAGVILKERVFWTCPVMDSLGLGKLFWLGPIQRS